MIRVHVLYGTPGGNADCGTRCDTVIAEDLEAATRAAVELARLRITGGKISATLFDDSSTILFYRNELLSSPPPGTAVKTITVTPDEVAVNPPGH